MFGICASVNTGTPTHTRLRKCEYWAHTPAQHTMSKAHKRHAKPHRNRACNAGTILGAELNANPLPQYQAHVPRAAKLGIFGSTFLATPMRKSMPTCAHRVLHRRQQPYISSHDTKTAGGITSVWCLRLQELVPLNSSWHSANMPVRVQCGRRGS